MLNVVGMCEGCKRGYVSVNWNNPSPACLACGSRLVPIEPMPNCCPHVNGAFVNEQLVRRADSGAKHG